MAMTLTLVRRDDFSADIESISLLNNTNGFSVERGGWAQQIAAEDEARVIETMTMYAKGTSHDNLATNLVALDKLLAKAKWYAESPERYALWLRAQLTNESHAREAVILSAKRGPAQTFSPPASPGNTIKGYALMLERTPLWEGAPGWLTIASGISGIGGATAIANTVGTDPARIALMCCWGQSSVPLCEFWWGIRTARHGTVASFVSPWELELGTAGTDTALATDNTASPGGGGNTKFNCTFATATAMTVRATLTPYQITSSNYNHLIGTFDLILRAKCASGITTRVQLSCGLPGTLSYFTCNPVLVTGTSWNFYNIGRVTIPSGGKVPYSLVQSLAIVRNTTMRISAELTTGSTVANALGLDCVVPIPVDDSYGHLKGISNYGVYLLISPLESVTAYDIDSSGYGNGIPTSDISPTKCNIPVGTHSIICAAQRAASSVLADTWNISCNAVPRWRTLRGDDA